VNLTCQRVDLPGESGVEVQLVFLLDEVMVGLRLLERRLSVLADHHERREEDRLERDDDGKHPCREDERMEVDEPHRAREGRDPIRQSELDVRLPLGDHLDHGDGSERWSENDGAEIGGYVRRQGGALRSLGPTLGIEPHFGSLHRRATFQRDGGAQRSGSGLRRNRLGCLSGRDKP